MQTTPTRSSHRSKAAPRSRPPSPPSSPAGTLRNAPKYSPAERGRAYRDGQTEPRGGTARSGGASLTPTTDSRPFGGGLFLLDRGVSREADLSCGFRRSAPHPLPGNSQIRTGTRQAGPLVLKPVAMVEPIGVEPTTS